MRRAWLVALLAAGTLLLPACGGGDEQGEQGGGTTTVKVSGKEFAFTPSALTAPADTDVTLEFKNEGTIEHDFTIDEANLKIKVPVAQTGTGTFNLPAGTYAIYCSVPGHRQSGMEGTLTVS